MGEGEGRDEEGGVDGQSKTWVLLGPCAAAVGLFVGYSVHALLRMLLAMKITERLEPIRIHCGVHHYGNALDYHQAVGVRLFFGMHSGCKSLQPGIVLLAS
jgi:hypothetical protein